ncbi:hypothetical protein ABIB37_000199 [Agrococcus sp. UYP10]
MSPRPGRITDVVAVERAPVASAADDAVRETDAFFRSVTAVREALHGRQGATPRAAPRGAEAR